MEKFYIIQLKDKTFFQKFDIVYDENKPTKSFRKYSLKIVSSTDLPYLAKIFQYKEKAEIICKKIKKAHPNENPIIRSATIKLNN